MQVWLNIVGMNCKSNTTKMRKMQILQKNVPANISYTKVVSTKDCIVGIAWCYLDTHLAKF